MIVGWLAIIQGVQRYKEKESNEVGTKEWQLITPDFQVPVEAKGWEQFLKKEDQVLIENLAT